ncbi:MAG: DUF4159 domain-containing protein [candidate division Zixibacteria bacterium]|nr:DUF4159 domain-containing protein [candidate division Zixibacteria bacterium]
MYKTGLLAFLVIVTISAPIFAQQGINGLVPQGTPVYIPGEKPPHPSAVTAARLHYGGGGDWYWGNSAIPNLLRFVAQSGVVPIDSQEHVIQIMDDNLFRYPFLFATGHGVMKFSNEERERLRTYLAHGGFLFINDSYGMEKGVRKEISRLFPERELVELPFDHDVYHCYYDFPSGPPKIHEHDNLPARGYGITVDGRLVLYYLLESDIGDGWEDPQVHNDPPEKRQEALEMGMNLLVYALTH